MQLNWPTLPIILSPFLYPTISFSFIFTLSFSLPSISLTLKLTINPPFASLLILSYLFSTLTYILFVFIHFLFQTFITSYLLLHDPLIIFYSLPIIPRTMHCFMDWLFIGIIVNLLMSCTLWTVYLVVIGIVSIVHLSVILIYAF